MIKDGKGLLKEQYEKDIAVQIMAEEFGSNAEAIEKEVEEAGTGNLKIKQTVEGAESGTGSQWSTDEMIRRNWLGHTSWPEEVRRQVQTWVDNNLGKTREKRSWWSLWFNTVFDEDHLAGLIKTANGKDFDYEETFAEHDRTDVHQQCKAVETRLSAHITGFSIKKKKGTDTLFHIRLHRLEKTGKVPKDALPY